MTIKTNKKMGNIWDALGIDKTIQKSTWQPSTTWPMVNAIDKNGKITMRTADSVMKEAGFAVDNMMPGNGAYGGGNVNINQINGLALDNVFLGWGELSLLQQNCLINNICTIMADSMTEKWIKFRSSDETKQDKIVELEQEIAKFNIKELINQAVHNCILLGTSYLSPKLKGDEEDLKNELIISPAKIKKGDLEDVFVIEPTWIVPIDFNMTNPRARNFYKPEAFIVFGERLHASRMKQLMYIKPVNLISPMYLFGGMPLIQELLPYILDFINTKREIVRIISRFNLSILQTNINALGGSDQYGKKTTVAGNVKARAATLNMFRNNFGVFLLDKETEAFTQMQINVSGLTDILQQQGELLSLFSRIPVSKLFGQSPRGMNATGEFDANNFNELIFANQESKLRPLLDYFFNIIQIHLWGDVDKDIEFAFVPLGSLNEKDQSQIKTDKVNRAVSLVQGGLADPAGMMDILINDPELELSNYEQSISFGADPDDDVDDE